MAELIRIARDGSSVIVKMANEYVRVNTSGEPDKKTGSTLTELTTDASWRRVTRADRDQYKSAVVIASGKIFVEEPVVASANREFRVPPTVKRSIAQALEAYSALLSDADREIATRLANRTAVDKDDIEWMHRFFENIEKAQSLHGGRRGQNWAKKVLASPEDEVEVLVASADEVDDTIFDYEADNSDILFVAGGDDEENGLFNSLYMVEYEDDDDEAAMAGPDVVIYEWKAGEFAVSDLTLETLDRPLLLEIDAETAKSLAAEIDGALAPADADEEDVQIGEFAGIDITSFDPIERNLFELAMSELDFEALERFSAILADATGYSPVERSHNAQRQPRASGGRFGGGGPAEDSGKLGDFAKAHLPEELPLVEDINALLDNYLASHSGSSETATEEEVDAPAPTPVIAAAPGESVDPLYLAIVDATDKTAVLEAVAIVPGENGEAEGWRREAGRWVSDPNVVPDLRGDTPPPLVELNDENVIKDVLTQIDAHDGQETEAVAASAWELAGEEAAVREYAATRGLAMFNGSFPIETAKDLEKAVRAFSLVSDDQSADVKRHIKKRARALNRFDILPDDWKTSSIFDDAHLSPVYGPYGEVVAMLAAGVPGVSDTPSDARAVRRLKEYWAHGAGAAKIRWGTPGDLTRCHRNVVKYLKNSGHAWGYCQNLHKELFGVSNATKDKKLG